MAVATKLILTDRSRMRAKYGRPGWERVRAAVRRLVLADRERGIDTRLVLIDGSTALSVKTAVDAAYATAGPPDYLMLLGAPDVVATASVANPLWTGDPADDPDPMVPCDLPYACDTALTATPGAYRGPSRVVGRLPDLVGARDPAYIVGLLGRAARWKAAALPRPLDVVAISTFTWRSSTQTSIAALGGAAGTVRTSPDEGPNWPPSAFQSPLVFVNCHGGQLDPSWYGERFAGQVNLPHAVDASRLTGRVRSGAVVAAECCYGAMHWNPSSAAGQPGVAQTLLREGAVGVFGASTVAYGPKVGNSAADIITRMFLEGVVAGASLGRAALEARQRYVAHEGSLGPTDLKTLLQFDLLGDPSVHAIAPVITDADTPAASQKRPPVGVARRRAVLRSTGEVLGATVGSVSAEPAARAGITRGRFAQAARLSVGDAAGIRIRTFDVAEPGERRAAAAAPPAERYHVAFVGSGARRSVVQVRAESGGPATAQRLYPKR